MKLNAALAKTLLMAASVGVVNPVLAETKPKAAVKSGATPPSNLHPTPTPTPPPEEPVIPGLVLPRKSGGFLSVTVDSGKLHVTFFDEKKKQVKADVARATARWNTNRKASEDRTVLNPLEDGTLLGTTFVYPPYNFRVFLTLLGTDGKAAENYIADLRKLPKS